MKTATVNGQEFQALSIRELHERLRQIIAAHESNDEGHFLDLPIVAAIPQSPTPTGRKREDVYAPVQFMRAEYSDIGDKVTVMVLQTGKPLKGV